MNNKNRNKEFLAILIFPPVWETVVPYLSIPSLTAFLEKNHIKAKQIDANIQFWKYLQQPLELKETFKRAETRYEYLKKSARPFSEESLDLFILDRIAKMGKNQFIDSVSKKILNRDLICYLLKRFSSFASVSSDQIEQGVKEYPNILYHDRHFYRISLSYTAQESEKLLRVIRNQDQNLFIRFYEKEILPSIVKISPNVIGISVTALNQVIPSFTLAFLIKKHLKNTIIVMGGTWITQLQDKIASIPELFSLIDIFVVFEGEHSLLNICNSFEQYGEKFSRDNISNLIYMKNGMIKRSPVVQNIDLNTLPTPNFSGYHLPDYDVPGHLPLASSKGCYWAKCKFCSYPTLELNYKERYPELIASDISRLKEIGAHYISFTDSVLSPKRIKQISLMLLNSHIQIDWDGFVRFEPVFLDSILKYASKAGLKNIYWGLESGSLKIQKSINKGIDPRTAKDILKIAKQEKIHNRLMVMYGFPDESNIDFLKTYEFIKNSNKNVDSFTFTRFMPEYNTPLGTELLKQGKAEEIGDLGIGLRYNRVDLESWKSLIDELEELTVK